MVDGPLRGSPCESSSGTWLTTMTSSTSPRRTVRDRITSRERRMRFFKRLFSSLNHGIPALGLSMISVRTSPTMRSVILSSSAGPVIMSSSMY
ncbi:hypothetical protein PMAYCL1PPCAC_31183 [Pristionchus mayeri]|uniref:Uncharacterized protein n=1 Tax=Pristionchus mayeri TaxID=1317129 RepID=A0AAN5ICD7_9BILA|nr:hypothetical protein PMAYCL1PPCAC_31183 [Pristionchus mayeri]